MAQAGDCDEDAQGVEVRRGQDFISLKEGQYQDDGREVLIEIGLGLQPRRGHPMSWHSKEGKQRVRHRLEAGTVAPG